MTFTSRFGKILASMCIFRCFYLEGDSQVPSDMKVMAALERPGRSFRIQVAPHLCNGCGDCVARCKEQCVYFSRFFTLYFQISEGIFLFDVGFRVSAKGEQILGLVADHSGSLVFAFSLIFECAISRFGILLRAINVEAPRLLLACQFVPRTPCSFSR